MSEELSLQNNEFYAEESGMDIIGWKLLFMMQGH